MTTHIVMDMHGDSRHVFDATDPRALVDAQEHFKMLTEKGFRAVEPGPSGSPGRLVRDFNAKAEEILFIPPLEGG
jgi:hypothetical protein